MSTKTAFEKAFQAGIAAVENGFRPSTIREAGDYFDEVELAYGNWDDVLSVIPVEDAKSHFLRGVAEALDRRRESDA